MTAEEIQLDDGLTQEWVVLGLCMEYPGVFAPKAIPALQEANFTIKQTKLLFREIEKRFYAGGIINAFATLSEIYREHGEPPAEFINSVDLPPYTAATGEWHLDRLLTISTGRNRIVALQQLQTELVCGNVDDSDYDAAIKELENLKVARADGAVTSRESVLEVINQIEMGNSDKTITRTWPQLDRALGGIARNDYIIVGARPSQGKTALAVNLLERISVIEHKPSLFISLETPHDIISKRLISLMANISMIDLTQNWDHMSDSERNRITHETPKAAKAGYHVADNTPYVDQVEKMIRGYHKKHEIQIFVLDYIQKVKVRKPMKEKRHEIEHISDVLHRLCMELPISIIALAQLNRDADTAEPTLAKLKDASALEQDAEKVILIHRPNWQDDLDEDGTEKGKLIIAKNKNGPTGDVPFRFLRQSMKFKFD